MAQRSSRDWTRIEGSRERTPGRLLDHIRWRNFAQQVSLTVLAITATTSLEITARRQATRSVSFLILVFLPG